MNIDQNGSYEGNGDTPVGENDEYCQQFHDEIAKVGQSRNWYCSEISIIRKRYGKQQKQLKICVQNKLSISNYISHKLIHRYTWPQETKNLRFISEYV